MSRPMELNKHGFKGAQPRPCIRNCGRDRVPGYSICKVCSAQEHAARKRAKKERESR